MNPILLADNKSAVVTFDFVVEDELTLFAFSLFDNTVRVGNCVQGINISVSCVPSILTTQLS